MRSCTAWLAGRDYVTPQDVQTMAFPVLRHRLLRSYHNKLKVSQQTK
ncbi:hypothetical protein OH492_11190 [Vibrio chagasii]|nr:hypothetical protein [Vibrio chagasii]